MSEHTQHHNTVHENNRKIITGAVAATVVTAALYGGYKVLEHQHNQETADLHEDRVEAVQSITKIDDEVIRLKSGAKLRLTPDTDNGSNADGSRSNVAEQVPKGKDLLVRLGMTSPEHPGWLAVTEPGVNPTKFKSVEDRAEHTYWINEDALRDQGMLEDTVYQGVVGHPITVQLDKNGQFISARNGEAVVSESKLFDMKAAGEAEFLMFGSSDK